MVAGKASKFGIEISPTSPLIYAGRQKLRNFSSFSTSLKFEPLEFENAARYPNCVTSLVKLGTRTPEKVLSVVHHFLKLHAKTC